MKKKYTNTSNDSKQSKTHADPPKKLMSKEMMHPLSQASRPDVKIWRETKCFTSTALTTHHAANQKSINMQMKLR
jgi:hypothetical protein